MSTCAYPELLKRGKGKVVNIGSMMSIFGGRRVCAYAASKGGVVQYTKSCAIAWAKDNIQVNAILPGWILTDLTRHGSYASPDKRHSLEDRTPTGRYGEPAELAGTAIFLASAASDWVTGVAIPVDGGYSAEGSSATVNV